MNWKLWLNGLIAALCSAIPDVIFLPALLDKVSRRQTIAVVLYGAVKTTLAYLKTHPPEVWDGSDRRVNNGQ